MFWKRYAYELKSQGKEAFFVALNKKDPVIKEDHVYVLEVDNHVQIDYIKPLLSEFIDYMRRQLKNYAVQIQLELSTDIADEDLYLSGKEKFHKLATKNANLFTLRTKFNLDIEH